MRVARVGNGTLEDIIKLGSPASKEEWPEAILKMINKLSPEPEEIVGGVAGIDDMEAATAFLNKNLNTGVRIYNDALMAGLGDAIYGAGKDKEVVGYIGLGTGIGTARISGKKIDSTGFEAGHHIMDISNNESWEEKVSGRVIKEKYGKYPQELDREAYEDYVKKIAIGVYNAILFWSPDILIIGGALINEKEGFKVEEIVTAISNINENLPALPPIVKSELGDNAGLYGAMAIIENESKAG